MRIIKFVLFILIAITSDAKKINLSSPLEAYPHEECFTKHGITYIWIETAGGDGIIDSDMNIIVPIEKSLVPIEGSTYTIWRSMAYNEDLGYFFVDYIPKTQDNNKSQDNNYVERNRMKELYSLRGKLIIPKGKYQTIIPLESGLKYIKVKKNNSSESWGLCNNDGKEILPQSYNDIKYENGSIYVKKTRASSWSMCDISKTIVYPIKHREKYSDGSYADITEDENQITTTTYRQCKLCCGGGKCSVCGGAGGRWGGFGSYMTYYNCRSCGADGRCKYCYGTGHSVTTHVFSKITNQSSLHDHLNNRTIYSDSHLNSESEANSDVSQNNKSSEGETKKEFCSHCSGTGVDLSPLGGRGYTSWIAHYHNGRGKCYYCNTYTEHWHDKCSYCNVPQY